MSHNFLFETYKFIDDRLDHINQELKKNDVSSTKRQYFAGRIDALCEIESFLEKNLKPKLPKRLRQNFSGKNRICAVDTSLSSSDVRDVPGQF